MKTEWLEVRCCCVPEKLLGWLNVPVKAKNIRLAFCAPPKFTVGKITNMSTGDIHISYDLPIEKIKVDGLTYRAIKAEGLTMDQLKRFSGFRPNDSTFKV